MIRCGKTGATLLYGTKCVGCDCQLAGFADGGTIPRDADAPRFFGVDLSRGPDRSATARVRMSQDYRFVVEEIDLFTVTSKEQAEAMARHARRMEDEIVDSLFGRNPYASRPDVTDPPWGAPPHRNAVEIITDPADRRGMDARRVGPCR